MALDLNKVGKKELVAILTDSLTGGELKDSKGKDENIRVEFISLVSETFEEAFNEFFSLEGSDPFNYKLKFKVHKGKRIYDIACEVHDNQKVHQIHFSRCSWRDEKGHNPIDLQKKFVIHEFDKYGKVKRGYFSPLVNSGTLGIEYIDIVYDYAPTYKTKTRDGKLIEKSQIHLNSQSENFETINSTEQ